MNIATFVASDSLKTYNPVVTWGSKLSRCFRKLVVPNWPAELLCQLLCQLFWQCKVMDDNWNNAKFFLWRKIMQSLFLNYFANYCANYFANVKSWMTTEIIKSFLGQLDTQLKLENLPSFFSWECHPETRQKPLNFIKFVLLPKHNTSKLKPADARIIHDLKSKYRKRLVRRIVNLLDRKTLFQLLLKTSQFWMSSGGLKSFKFNEIQWQS